DEEYLSRPFRRHGGAIQEHLLILAVVGTQSNDVALVGRDEDQVILPKESENRRVRLAGFISCLDRECDMVVVTELETDNRMADILRPPSCEEKVRVPKLREINRPVAPAIRVIGFGAIVAVTQVVNRDTISVDFDRGCSISVGPPIPVVRRAYAEPPRQHDTEAGKTESGSPEPSFDLDQDRDNRENIDHGQRNAQRCYPKINVESCHCPESEQGENQPHDHESKHPQSSESPRSRPKAKILSIHNIRNHEVKSNPLPLPLCGTVESPDQRNILNELAHHSAMLGTPARRAAVWAGKK